MLGSTGMVDPLAARAILTPHVCQVLGFGKCGVQEVLLPMNNMTRDVPSRAGCLTTLQQSRNHTVYSSLVCPSPSHSNFLHSWKAMSSAWYDQAIAPDGNLKDGCRPEEAQALRLYLDNKIEVQEAARLITTQTESSQDPGADLPDLWGVLQDALIELPNVQPKVVHLL
jgi:hypothetical protein